MALAVAFRCKRISVRNSLKIVKRLAFCIKATPAAPDRSEAPVEHGMDFICRDIFCFSPDSRLLYSIFFQRHKIMRQCRSWYLEQNRIRHEGYIQKDSASKFETGFPRYCSSFVSFSILLAEYWIGFKISMDQNHENETRC